MSFQSVSVSRNKHVFYKRVVCELVCVFTLLKGACVQLKLWFMRARLRSIQGGGSDIYHTWTNPCCYVSKWYRRLYDDLFYPPNLGFTSIYYWVTPWYVSLCIPIFSKIIIIIKRCFVAHYRTLVTWLQTYGDKRGVLPWWLRYLATSIVLLPYPVIIKLPVKQQSSSSPIKITNYTINISGLPKSTSFKNKLQRLPLAKVKSFVDQLVPSVPQ